MTRTGWVNSMLVALVILLMAPTARAQDPIHKASRGLLNLLTGWIEVPKQLHLASSDPSPLHGFGRGLFKGAGLALMRGGVGLYELVTFPLPHPDHFASPYTAMELPDYAWQ